MAIQITHIRISLNGTGHESITDYKWRNEATGSTDANDKPSMVAWVDQSGNSAYVSNSSTRAYVGVVRPKFGAPYLRTHADGVWTDNLLSLPRF